LAAAAADADSGAAQGNIGDTSSDCHEKVNPLIAMAIGEDLLADAVGSGSTASGVAPSPTGTPAPAPAAAPPPPPIKPSISKNQAVVVVKKSYTKPPRVPVQLKTDKSFDGTGTFTPSPPDTILFFRAATGGAVIKIDGKDNVFPGKALTAGVTLFAEGAKASGKADDVNLTLHLTGGSKTNGPDDTATMTAIEATLDICQRRVSAGTDPTPLGQAEKNDPGRAIYLQDSGKFSRAMIILRAQPSDMGAKVQLSLAPTNDKVTVFQNETGDPGAGNPFDVTLDSTFPADGKKLWVEGTKVSEKVKDTILKLGVKGVFDDADHVAVTVIHTQLDICHTRTDPAKDPTPLTAADKVGVGRFLQLQDAKNLGTRAMVIVHKVQPDTFKGSVVLTSVDDKVQLFEKEKPAGEGAFVTPLEITNSDLVKKERHVFGEGAKLSTKLIDTGFKLGVKDVEDEVDRVVCTVLSVKFQKIQTSDSAGVFSEDDDFCPILNEKARVQVKVEHLFAGFAGRLRIDFGRLTNRADKPSTPEVNESFTRVSRVEVDVAGGNDIVQVDWDGKSTEAVVQEFSNRTTPDVNTAKNVNIPLPAIANAQTIPHGLYFIDQITLLKDGEEIAKDRPDNVDLSVPIVVNLTFNGNWVGSLQAFGLSPFQADIEEALCRFGGRDYMIRNGTLANRINARFVNNAGTTNTQGILLSIGGTDPSDSDAGATPTGPAPLFNNLFAIFDSPGGDISIFPSMFLLFNNTATVSDQTTFRAIFSPLGVTPAQTDVAPGTAGARAVDGTGKVTGSATALDVAHTTVVWDADGMATVTSKDPPPPPVGLGPAPAPPPPPVVPGARAADIQAALRAFIKMLGNTINHESAHGMGVASVVRANNKITIGATTVTSPLNGDGGAHNKVNANTNIMDRGTTRSFVRRVEANGGPQQSFNASNTQYLRDCVPFDGADN
jgi:hypothetical protein